MSNQSEQYLELFKGVDWFHACGLPILNDSVALFVGTWNAAVKEMKRKRSEIAWFEFRNRLTEQLWLKAPDRYNRWKKIYNEKYESLVNSLFEGACNNRRGFDVPVNVRGDIGHFFMELEFADIVPPSYFATRAEWYLAGRLPCGWEGKAPEGRLIVY